MILVTLQFDRGVQSLPESSSFDVTLGRHLAT